MRVLIAHAYSARNSGDGLLVELSMKLVQEALPGAKVAIVALDSESFDRLGVPVIQWGHRSAAGSSRLNVALAGLLGPDTRVHRLLRDADLVMAVGGGYMRGGTLQECLKSLMSHGRQLAHLARCDAPTIYLPQSIGPFPRGVSHIIKSRLARVDRVFVRDDMSREFLGGGVPAERHSDLVVSEIARNFKRPRERRFSGYGVVARRLSNGLHYEQMLKELSLSAPRPQWFYQSKGRGNDDPGFISGLVGGDARPLSELWSADQRSDHEGTIIVSVRLHGALESILNGVPAVHLSYERKGWAAFEDLGLGGFVLDARRATRDEVLQRVLTIKREPAAYWDMVELASAKVVARHTRMVEDIRRVASSRGVVSDDSGELL